MKITFTGPESSGKTSVSKAVAEHFDVQWFPEYARAYLMERNGNYDFEDIEQIAIEQEESRKSNEESGLKIYDTEATVLYVWSMFKYKNAAAKVKFLMKEQRFMHYFLCSPEGILWEEDPLRESPNHREELFDLYLEELRKQKVDFTILKGTFEERKDKAIEIIESLILSKGGFCI